MFIAPAVGKKCLGSLSLFPKLLLQLKACNVSCAKVLVLCCLVEATSAARRYTDQTVASSPGHSQILSRSRREKLGEGLGSKLRHGPEMVDLVCTNRVHHFWSVT